MKEEAKAAAKAGRVPHVEIKTFANVPMADFEVILPAQRTITRASDILKLLAVIGGAAACVLHPSRFPSSLFFGNDVLCWHC